MRCVELNDTAGEGTIRRCTFADLHGGKKKGSVNGENCQTRKSPLRAYGGRGGPRRRRVGGKEVSRRGTRKVRTRRELVARNRN